MKLPGLLLALFLSIGLTQVRAYEPPKPSQPVQTLNYEWQDTARQREVPVKIYLPKASAGPAPVIIFSHGLGGSRDGYVYLGEYWAGCGYISVHLQHHGSDDAVWKNAPEAERMQALKNATLQLANIANRPKDVSVAIDRLLALNQDASSPLHGRIDAEKIGIAGHSFGGFTTMAIAGQAFGPTHWADSRVKAAIQMSAPLARPNVRDTAYNPIKIPVFHMTGTLDDSPLGDTKADERRIAFDKMSNAETCLLILKGGDHMVFAGVGPEVRALPKIPGYTPEARAHDAEFQKLICESSIAFWDAYLKNEAPAHDWLLKGPFAKELGDRGTFEVKSPAK